MSAALLPNNTQFFHAPITYQTYTFSTALTIDVSDEHSLIVNLNSAQRAPEIQELLSLGPHLATRSYVIGLLLGERQQAEEPPKAETLTVLNCVGSGRVHSDRLTAQSFTQKPMTLFII